VEKSVGFRWFVSILLGAVLAPPGTVGFAQLGGPSTGQERVDQLFQEAQSDVAKGNYDAAAGQYRKALTLEPHSPQALSNLGVCLYLGGHPQAAVQPLQDALRIDPSQLPANLILGMAYVRLGEYEKALTPLQRVLRQDGKNRDALLALASAFFGLGQNDKAGEVYAREVSAYPADADGWYGAGVAFERVAEDAARKLSEIGKGSPYNQHLLGEYLTEEEAGIEAEGALRQALAASGKDAEALHAALGFALLRLDEPSQALAEFQSELRLHPGNLDGKLGLAAAQLETGHLAKGFEGLCGIVQTDEGYLQSHTSFLVTFLGPDIQSEIAGNTKDVPPSRGCQKAVARIEGEISSPGSSLDPQRAFTPLASAQGGAMPLERLAVSRASQASEAGRYDECVRDLLAAQLAGFEDGLSLSRCACLSGRYLVSFEASRNVLNEGSRNLQGYYWQAESARNLAKVAFERAMSLSPNSWQSQVLLGDIYRQRKNWDAATFHYRSAAQLKPDGVAAFLGLATLCWENGWFDRAKQSLHKVLELDAENAQANLEMGDIAVRSRAFEEALPFLRRALARSAHNSLLVHADLGRSYAELGQAERAIPELTQALPMDESGEIHYQLYRAYQKQGQVKLAEEALAESERLRHQDAQDRQHRLDRAAQLKKGGQSQ
jgi:tetratricopeptide (TPR) repeat protein